MTNPTSIMKSIFIAAPRTVVWAYLTEATKLGEWYHKGAQDLAEGQPYELIREGEDGAPMVVIRGEVREWKAPERLVTTFCIPPFGEAETVVTWELSEVEGGTRLLLTHEGVAEAAGDAPLGLLKALDAGWDQHLGDLRTHADA